MQAYIDSFYATFAQRVADGRKLPAAKVEAVGRGHVWSGGQAKERGLIDGFGSLLDAVARAKARGHLGPGEPVDIVTFSGASTTVDLGSLAGALGLTSAPGELARVVERMVEATGAAPALLFESGQPLALPEDLPVLR